jgi:hypothetical protein
METEDQVKCGLLLYVIVAQSAAILELLSNEDETLLVQGGSFLILDLGLAIINRVGRLDIEGDGLSSEGFDEDLHSSAETKHQVKGGLFLDDVVTQSAAILELLSGEDETLLIRVNTFLLLDLGLDLVNAVGWLDIEGDSILFSVAMAGGRTQFQVSYLQSCIFE